jgi:hypothetical protein
MPMTSPKTSAETSPMTARAKVVCACAAALVLAVIAAIVPATAQFPAAPDDAAAAKGKKGAAAAPTINGNWAGELTQVGSPTPYKFELTINAKGAETKYPDLDCIGKLTRSGSSKTYTFFVEVITKGSADKGGRCPDGTMTLARQGDNLALGWFGSVQGTTVVAYGTLKKK